MPFDLKELKHKIVVYQLERDRKVVLLIMDARSLPAKTWFPVSNPYLKYIAK